MFAASESLTRHRDANHRPTQRSLSWLASPRKTGKCPAAVSFPKLKKGASNRPFSFLGKHAQCGAPRPAVRAERTCRGHSEHSAGRFPIGSPNRKASTQNQSTSRQACQEAALLAVTAPAHAPLPAMLQAGHFVLGLTRTSSAVAPSSRKGQQRI